MQQPTQQQIDHSAIANDEFVTLLDRLVTEGLDYRAVLAGAASAMAQSINKSAGREKVAPWFNAQAELWTKLNGDA